MKNVLDIAAACQARLDTPYRSYYRRKLVQGKTRPEAMRCLKRRISDAVYRQLLAAARRAATAAAADPKVRIREGTAGRHLYPARPTLTRSSTLRISHFPDPHPRRYAPHQTRRPDDDPSTPPVDNRGEPDRRTSMARPTASSSVVAPRSCEGPARLCTPRSRRRGVGGPPRVTCTLAGMARVLFTSCPATGTSCRCCL